MFFSKVRILLRVLTLIIVLVCKAGQVNLISLNHLRLMMVMWRRWCIIQVFNECACAAAWLESTLVFSWLTMIIGRFLGTIWLYERCGWGLDVRVTLFLLRMLHYDEQENIY